MTAPAFGAREICLGWRYVPPQQDPGPPPRRPVPPPPTQLAPGWLAAQRREERLLSRPATAALAASLAGLAGVILLGQAGLLNPALTGLAAGAAAVAGMRSGRARWRSRRELRATVEAETRRVAALRAKQERQHISSQQDHASWFRAWQAREQAFARQPQWHPVALPGEVQRIDVVGGTLAGWSALLTMLALPRLAAGGEVTVLDLTEGAVAGDLVAVAAGQGLGPLVWLLPGDLPRFDLGVGLPAADLAEVLAATASASVAPAEGQAAGGTDPAADHAIVLRVTGVLGDGATIGQVMAGLRALGQVGDPRADVTAGLLSAEQVERITGLFGRTAADRVVTGRALALEARLRVLAGLGTEPVPLPPSKLRVAALGHDGGAFGSPVLGTYLVVSLTHLLRQARAGRSWRHTICLAGAEKLPGDVLDRLTTACEVTRTGLVLAYRSAPAQVKQRLGRGNAALAVMRLGNADDAKVVSEQIGTEHRFVISQLTDTVGATVTDTSGGSYTTTVGTSDAWSASESTSQTTGRSRGRGHSHTGAAPFTPRTGSSSKEASESRSSSDARSLTEGISTSTSWGVSTSRALGTSESLARTAQRSREFLVEPHELQQLPASAVIVSYASPTGRQVVLADANPALLTLGAAAADVGDEAGAAADGRAGDGQGDSAGRAEPAQRWVAEPASWRAREGAPPPNLGPPREPPDWRRHRHRHRFP
ncbi:MAG TPA: hypothetical protein VH641_13315 [Streptosporangiaceae bacterium]